MKNFIPAIIFSLLFSSNAKPGGSYVLTGREKSIFSIFQADLKANPELYAGEDVNAYYQAFKSLNKLGERKLKLGEELVFPDTAISKRIREAEAEKAAKAAKQAAAEARARTKETQTVPSANESDGQVTLFGSDRRSSRTVNTPENQQARNEAQRKNARYKAIDYYQHTLLPHMMFDYGRDIAENFEKGNIDTLVKLAKEQIDEQFANALVLHAYPDKKIYVLEFENPKKVDAFFFFALKRENNGRVGIFSLEKGISFFGTGEESVLHEWQSGNNTSNLGGRKYKDLPSFLMELETGKPAPSSNE